MGEEYLWSWAKKYSWDWNTGYKVEGKALQARGENGSPRIVDARMLINFDLILEEVRGQQGNLAS